MKYKKYLPVGTVVLLNDAQKKIVIMGYGVQAVDDKKIYDYSACFYPEGIITPDKTLLFNHEQIKEVYYMGYSDEEWKKLNPILGDMIDKARNEGQNK